MQELMPIAQGIASGTWDVVEVSSCGCGATAIRVLGGMRYELQLVRSAGELTPNVQPGSWQGQLRVTNSFGVSEATLFDLETQVEDLPDYVARTLSMPSLDRATAGLAKAVSLYEGCISVSSPAIEEFLASGVIPFGGASAVLVTPAFSAAMAAQVKLGDRGDKTWPLVDPLTGRIVKFVSPVWLYTQLLTAKMTCALGLAWQSEFARPQGIPRSGEVMLG